MLSNIISYHCVKFHEILSCSFRVMRVYTQEIQADKIQNKKYIFGINV